MKSYAAGILDKLRELQVDLRATPAVFMGGGAALFQPFIEESSQVTKAALEELLADRSIVLATDSKPYEILQTVNLYQQHRYVPIFLE